MFRVLLEPVRMFYYIDPGTGSLILQALVASFLGGLFILKSYIRRIINKLFKRKKSE